MSRNQCVTSQWLCPVLLYSLWSPLRYKNMKHTHTKPQPQAYSHWGRCLAPPCCYSGNCVCSPTGHCRGNLTEPSSPPSGSFCQFPVGMERRVEGKNRSMGPRDQKRRLANGQIHEAIRVGWVGWMAWDGDGIMQDETGKSMVVIWTDRRMNIKWKRRDEDHFVSCPVGEVGEKHLIN